MSGIMSWILARVLAPKEQPSLFKGLDRNASFIGHKSDFLYCLTEVASDEGSDAPGREETSQQIASDHNADEDSLHVNFLRRSRRKRAEHEQAFYRYQRTLGWVDRSGLRDAPPLEPDEICYAVRHLLDPQFQASLNVEDNATSIRRAEHQCLMAAVDELYTVLCTKEYEERIDRAVEWARKYLPRDACCFWQSIHSVENVNDTLGLMLFYELDTQHGQVRFPQHLAVHLCDLGKSEGLSDFKARNEELAKISSEAIAATIFAVCLLSLLPTNNGLVRRALGPARRYIVATGHPKHHIVEKFGEVHPDTIRRYKHRLFGIFQEHNSTLSDLIEQIRMPEEYSYDCPLCSKEASSL